MSESDKSFEEQVADAIEEIARPCRAMVAILN